MLFTLVMKGNSRFCVSLLSSTKTSEVLRSFWRNIVKLNPFYELPITLTRFLTPYKLKSDSAEVFFVELDIKVNTASGCGDDAVRFNDFAKEG